MVTTAVRRANHLAMLRSMGAPMDAEHVMFLAHTRARSARELKARLARVSTQGLGVEVARVRMLRDQRSAALFSARAFYSIAREIVRTQSAPMFATIQELGSARSPIVFGVGESEAAAIEDAIGWIGVNTIPSEAEDVRGLRTLPCTPSLAEYVLRCGGVVPCEVVDGVLHLRTV